MSFSEAIAIELTLTIGSTSVTVPGAHIKRFELELESYGFQGMVEFWDPYLYTSKNDLFTSFKSLDLMKVALSVKAQYNMPDTAPDAIAVTGLCTRKSVSESGYGTISGADAYHREYRIEFADIAQVLWKQHFPSVLLTESTLDDLIDGEKPSGLSLTSTWAALTTEHKMLFLPLDRDHSQASFYDFLMWLVDTQNGVFTYSHADDSYTLATTKGSVSSPSAVSEYQVDEVEVAIPETIRYSAAVLNAVAESSANTAIPQTQAVTGVRRDMLMRTQVPADVDTRVALETARLIQREPTPIVHFSTFPTITITPGSGVTFETTSFTQHSSWLTGDHRVIALSMRGHAVDASANKDVDQAHTEHQVELSVRLEPSGESYVSLPAYTRPRWPILVEGKVLSTSGEDTDKTYTIAQDQDSSLYMYSVNIPLWDKDVDAPLYPLGQPGHFFFPAFKAQRVLVALYFQEAFIVRFLDFGARVQLPMDTQANHILFGQNATSETSMRYAYEDGKSLFEVKRVMDNDHVTLQMKDGLLYLEVREDDSES